MLDFNIGLKSSEYDEVSVLLCSKRLLGNRNGCMLETKTEGLTG